MNQQLLRFASVGLLVTVIDFLTLNALLFVRISFLIANILSVTIAMIVSYFLNKRHVFGQKTTSTKQKALFIVGTMFALYGLQTLVIYLFSTKQVQVQPHLEIFSFGVFSTVFLFNNLAKGVATIVSTVWNYVFYKFVVFDK